MGYDLDAPGKARLDDFMSRIGEILRHKKKKEAFALYGVGLLSKLDRKSVEPIAACVCPDEKLVDAMHQKLLHFQSEAAWDDRAVRLSAARYAIDAMTIREPVRAWIIDDTGFLKQGDESVGVQRQYTGSAGKVTNCQVGVSLTVSTSTAHLPVDFELYLPQSWTTNPERRQKAKIPADLKFKTKTDLALEMITRACLANLPGEVVLADSAYGESVEFRTTVALLGFDYAVGTHSNTKFIPTDQEGQPVGEVSSAKNIAKGLPETAFQRITWRQGTSAPLSARFVFVRGRVDADGPDGDVHWLIIEWRDGEKAPAHFALTTLGVKVDMPKVEVVRIFKERYRTEQTYEELKGEVGLDHFEGRSFTGWHHHVSVVLCCYAFVIAERTRRFPPSAEWSQGSYPLSLAA